MSNWTLENIRNILRVDVLFKGLELEDLGVSLDEIQDEVGLVGDLGLALDSVDALEIVSQIQVHFGLNIADANKSFFEKNLATFGAMLAFVAKELNVDDAGILEATA